ncbi:hypothetical protein O6R16_03160 [Candidatus Rickettsia tasmanensis]
MELITKDLSEIAANPINNTITSSTAEISESIFSDNTESWTETGINLINNTVANLTNTAFNTTYNSQENMFDESDNDNSLVAQYISIGTAVVASIAVIIGVGVKLGYVRNKNATKAKLKQYIDEIEAEKLAAEINEDVTTENNTLLDNDHAVVDMTGVSYEEEGTLV